MRRATALVTLTGFALAPRAIEAQEVPLSGLDDAIGRSVFVIVEKFGPPHDVESLDSGHTWIWSTERADLRVTTDDRATIKAIDDHPLTSGDRLASVELFGYTKERADKERGTADLSGKDFRTYDLGSGHVLELFFDDAGKLTHAVYGDRGYVARLGLIPADREMLRILKYTAPKLRRTPPSLSGFSATVVRCEIGKNGHVDTVSLAVSSHHVVQDRLALAFARKTSWAPAKLDGVPVKSVAFWMVR